MAQSIARRAAGPLRSTSAMLVLVAGMHLMSAGTARAQEFGVIDPSVFSVVTGGFWNLGGHDGEIRLVVTTQGFDHLISRLYVQWLEHMPEGMPTPILRTVQVKDIPEVWTLGVPVFRHVDDGWIATIEGTNTHQNPPTTGHWTLTFGAPGDVHVRKGK